jgi:hypothetical protein
MGAEMSDDLVSRLRDVAEVVSNGQELCEEAAAKIERLRAALEVVREYPDFDDGGPLPDMMDQVLRGEPSPMLEKLAEWERIFGARAARATKGTT